MTYQAPAACPGANSYVRQVQSRATALSIELQPGAPQVLDATRVSVGLSESPQGWVGSLEIADADGLSRTVRGDRCEDVVEALALITVLRLEPSAIAAAGPERAAAAAGVAPSAGRAEIASSGELSGTLASSAARTPGASAEGRPVENPGSDETRAGAGTPAVEAPEPEAVPVDGAMPEASISAGASDPIPSRATIAAVPPPLALPTSGEDSQPPVPSAPEPSIDVGDQELTGPSSSEPLSLGVAAYLGYASVPSNALVLALQAEIPFGAPRGWAASIIVAYTRGSDENASGSGTFNLWTAEAQLCGPGVAQPAWWLQPCAAARAGLLELDFSPGEQTSSAPGATRPWATLGPRFQAGVPLSSGWTLRALGGLSFILVRDRFEIARTIEPEPGAPAAQPVSADFYRPGLLSFELGIGLGHTF